MKTENSTYKSLKLSEREVRVLTCEKERKRPSKSNIKWEHNN